MGKYEKVFADKLKELREKENLSQNDLDIVLGYNDSPVSEFERGACFPKFETLLMLADFFRVSIDYLVGRSENSNLS
jgi:transcriptional regulator with XRE-family HTH domain